MKLTSAKTWFKFIFVSVLIGISSSAYNNATGPSASLTGAPGESNCTSCHSGSPVTSGTAHGSITLTGIPVGGYIPGNTYSITVAGGTAATSRNGFQITALTNANAMAGSFISGTGSQTIIGSGKSYVNHTLTGTSQSSWTFSWTAPASAVGTITFYLAFNATNNSNTNVGDVVYLKSFSFDPGNLPVPVITSPANNAVFCLGDSIQFQGSASNSPTAFNWQFLGNVPNTANTQNPKVLFSVAGFTTVRLTATNAGGTSSPVSISIQIVAKPSATISPSTPQVVCGNDSITLTANAGTGFSYLWSPGNLTTQSIKVGAAGSYTVRVSNSANCFRVSNAVAVTTAPKPSMTLVVSKDTLCNSDTLLMTATSGFNSYVYFVNGLKVDSTASNSKKLLLPVGLDSVSVIGYYATCSSYLISKMVYVEAKDPAPSLACGTGTSSSVTFDVGANTLISLDSGKIWTSPNGAGFHTISGLNPNQAVTLWSKRIQNGVCLYSQIATKTCIASSCQPLSLLLNYSKYNCLSSNTDSVPSQVIVSNLSATQYISFNNGALGRTMNHTLQVKLGNNSLLMRVLDSANIACGIKDSTLVLIGVNPIGSLPVLNPDRAVYCENGDISISLSNKPASANVYKYFKNADSLPFVIRNKSTADLPLNSLLFYQFKKNDQIRVQAIDSVYGCSKTSLPVTLNIVPPSPAGFTFIKQNLNIQLTDTVRLSQNRSWFFGDGTSVINGPKVQTHTYAAAGNYMLTMQLRDSNNCYSSDSTLVNIVATGMEDNLFSSGGLLVYPNPASQCIYLKGDIDVREELHIDLFDMSGRKCLSRDLHIDTPVDLSMLEKGSYVLKLNSKDKTGWVKIIVN